MYDDGGSVDVTAETIEKSDAEVSVLCVEFTLWILINKNRGTWSTQEIWCQVFNNIYHVSSEITLLWISKRFYMSKKSVLLYGLLPKVFSVQLVIFFYSSLKYVGSIISNITFCTVLSFNPSLFYKKVYFQHIESK